MKKIAIALLLGCSLVACGDKKAEEKKDDKGGSGSASGEIGVAECDDYIKKMEACLGKLPAEAKPAMETSLKGQRDAWSQAAKAGGAAKDGLKTGCKAAADALAANPACK